MRICTGCRPRAPARAEIDGGLAPLNMDQIAERGARLSRRDDREYREYLREEQRRQTGCPAREVVLDQRGQASYIADFFEHSPAMKVCLTSPLRSSPRKKDSR